MKTLAAGLSMALALTCVDAQAATVNIKVAVASSFGKAANDLAAAFQAYYATFGLTYTVSLTIASAQSLESSIISAGASTPYDLLLSSSKKEPKDLVDNYPSLIVGTPFKYAKDFLALYSKSVDIHSGLPYPLTTNFLIPDPTTDVYGEAAAEVLSSAPWYINSATIPTGYVFTAPTVGSAFTGVDRGYYSYGFVAKSQICSLASDGTQTYPPGSYHHIYKPNDVDHPSDKLILKGIKIAHSRTADQETELSNFIAFLTGVADSNGNTTAIGTGVIEGHCFKSF
ncbi:MAG TPA: substrate-binding domain-containing protein [Methylosinus sp.]|jgi:molybdate transport system substrate-binding protein|uniref:molybdate ABC transporter substrate-binding protein n=1 Tax=Methylosinus sp. TaxID=427 RepID=UPI002F94E1F7